MSTSWAPYMEWSKKRPPATFDLAGSNLLGCTVDDLPGWRDVVEVNGLNPDGYAPLLELIAARYGVDASRVVTASGAGGANFLAIATLVRPGDDVVVERPTYDPMEGAVRLMGGRVVPFDRPFEDGWSVDPDRVHHAMTDRTRLIVLTRPHNPSGAMIDDVTLREIARRARRAGARVLVDEVYLDGVYGERPAPAATLADEFVSVNSLTKSFGLSGLRAGWIIANPVAAEAMRRVRDAMDGVGSYPSDRLAWFAFRNIDVLEARARSILVPNLDRVAAFMASRTDLEWVRPAGGNVAFPRVIGRRSTDALADRLLEYHETAIVPGRFFGKPEHFRIAFSGRADTLEGGLERIRLALDESSTGRASR